MRADLLKSEGWPTPVTVEPGNGVHLYYAIDLPNDPETTSLVKRLELQRPSIPKDVKLKPQTY